MALNGIIKNMARDPRQCARTRRNNQQLSTAPIALNPTHSQVTLEQFESTTLPAYGNTGRIVWSTDNNSIYVDTGSAWVAVALGG
jgi:hypothetical protein